MIRRTAVSLLALPIIVFTSAIAQFSIEPFLTTMQDDNINNDYLRVRDNITTLGLSSSCTWEKESSSLALSYDGSLHYYQTVINRTNNAHQLGLLYPRISGADGNEIFGTVRFQLCRACYCQQSELCPADTDNRHPSGNPWCKILLFFQGTPNRFG